jgi:L-amino acid N-acyltransferase YncA
VLRWRGPFLLTLLAVRELLRPLVYWHVFYVFETDVAQQPLPEAYSKEKLEVRVYTREKDVDKAKAEVVAMGELSPDEFGTRLDRGDAVAIAYAAGEPAGYGWLSFSSGVVELAFGITWVVRSQEVVRYGNFVAPKWRGRGIHSSVNAAMNAYARQLGIARTLASISTLNTQSMSLAKHYSKARTMKVTLVHVRGMNWMIHWASGAPFESRFMRTA